MNKYTLNFSLHESGKRFFKINILLKIPSKLSFIYMVLLKILYSIHSTNETY